MLKKLFLDDFMLNRFEILTLSRSGTILYINKFNIFKKHAKKTFKSSENSNAVHASLVITWIETTNVKQHICYRKNVGSLSSHHSQFC